MAQFVSHKDTVDAFYNDWELNPVICDIVAPYKKSVQGVSRKRKRKANEPPLANVSRIAQKTVGPLIRHLNVIAQHLPEIQLRLQSFIASLPSLSNPPESRADNKDALTFMDTINSLPYPSNPFNGANTNDHSIECELNGEQYLIPKNCRFFNKNVLDIRQLLPLDNQFDLIVMDPPWWNKYIRRINSVKQENGYKMMDNEAIKSLPIDQLLNDQGLLVIWCTNSPTHRHSIEKDMLPHWGLTLVTVWHWVKVTTRREAICEFHPGTGKQPYELIFIAAREGVNTELIPKDHMLISVPSVIHSHKFPIFSESHQSIDP